MAELASAIGVSEGAIRRHMDIMVAEGLLVSGLRRNGRGRPAARYALSEAGEEQTASQHYARLLGRLHPALAQLTADEVGGQGGAAVLDRVFDGVADGVADRYSNHVTATELAERVQQVTAALREEGILDEVIDEGDSYRLLNVGCPYRSTAEETHAACAADRRTIELLLERPVDQVMTVAGGALTCEYLVSKQTEASGEPRGVRSRTSSQH